MGRNAILTVVTCLILGASWQANSENITATTEHGKRVLLKEDGTWEYVELKLEGKITFKIISYQDYHRSHVERDDSGEITGVQTGTGCNLTIEVINALSFPIVFNDSVWIRDDTIGDTWMFYIPIAANIIPPDGKGKMESMMKPTRRVFFENKSKLSEADKKQLIDDYGCQLYKGHTAVLQKEHIKLTTVPDNATDVDILSLIEVLPSDFLNFITRWR